MVAIMDAARALIAEADAAAQRPPATAKAEAIVREWWARKRGSVPRAPIFRMEVAGTVVGAERLWPMAVTLALAIAVPLLLPPRFSLGPSWVIPVVEVLLLVAVVVADRGRFNRRPAGCRPGYFYWSRSCPSRRSGWSHRPTGCRSH